MAVQVPDPGTGNGQTGDNEYVFRKKVRDNFSDQSNAASREVGLGSNQIPLSSQSYKAAYSSTDGYKTSSSGFDYDNADYGSRYLAVVTDTNHSPKDAGNGIHYVETKFIYDTNTALQSAVGYDKPTLSTRLKKNNAWLPWVYHYNTANTTTDSNGFIKASSPVLRIFNDRIEGNADGDKMAATYTKNGVGDYTIIGTTGLRTDGWYITIPNDMNGNPKVAVTLDDTDGVITLRSYVRIFDMTTFKFVPDLNQPLDIPDGRWIDLRFNDSPQDEV